MFLACSLILGIFQPRVPIKKKLIKKMYSISCTGNDFSLRLGEKQYLWTTDGKQLVGFSYLGKVKPTLVFAYQL